MRHSCAHKCLISGWCWNHGRFEVLDVTNQREEKRVVVLTHRKAGGMPQEVVAELFPVIKQKNVQKGRRARCVLCLIMHAQSIVTRY